MTKTNEGLMKYTKDPSCFSCDQDLSSGMTRIEEGKGLNFKPYGQFRLLLFWAKLNKKGLVYHCLGPSLTQGQFGLDTAVLGQA